MSSIGRRFDRESSSVFSVISPTGGIRPPVRRRAGRTLSLGEREEISRGLSAHCSLRRIALRATRSDRAAWGSNHAAQALQACLQAPACPHSIRQAAAQMVARADRRLAQARLPRGAPEPGVPRNDLPQPVHPGPRRAPSELLRHLRAKRTIRRSRHASLKRNGLGQIKDAISISERPASVEDRAVPGHWEGDLIGGSKNSYVATLVERRSRYVMLVKVANKDTGRRLGPDPNNPRKLPGGLYQSLTWDPENENRPSDKHA